MILAGWICSSFSPNDAPLLNAPWDCGKQQDIPLGTFSLALRYDFQSLCGQSWLPQHAIARPEAMGLPPFVLQRWQMMRRTRHVLLLPRAAGWTTSARSYSSNDARRERLTPPILRLGHDWGRRFRRWRPRSVLRRLRRRPRWERGMLARLLSLCPAGTLRHMCALNQQFPLFPFSVALPGHSGKLIRTWLQNASFRSCSAQVNSVSASMTMKHALQSRKANVHDQAYTFVPPGSQVPGQQLFQCLFLRLGKASTGWFFTHHDTAIRCCRCEDCYSFCQGGWSLGFDPGEA